MEGLKYPIKKHSPEVISSVYKPDDSIKSNSTPSKKRIKKNTIFSYFHWRRNWKLSGWLMIVIIAIGTLSCKEENITPTAKLKFFNTNTESINLLDGEENFIAELPARDTTLITVSLDFNNKFITQYASCLKSIDDQFFIKDIIILTPNFVTCKNFDLLDGANFSEREKEIYQKVIDEISIVDEGYLIAQNTREIIRIGDIDFDSKISLEKEGNFTFDSSALANYKLINQAERQISINTFDNYSLISKSEVNCFVSNGVDCEYVENINCTYEKGFIQFSQIGFSEDQAIVTYNIQCCRGFAIFNLTDSGFELAYQRLLC
ncbi:MAG: hypothetical protein RIA69_18720 [Cyclobacteriaceae bacterium]